MTTVQHDASAAYTASDIPIEFRMEVDGISRRFFVPGETTPLEVLAADAANSIASTGFWHGSGRALSLPATTPEILEIARNKDGENGIPLWMGNDALDFVFTSQRWAPETRGAQNYWGSCTGKIALAEESGLARSLHFQAWGRIEVGGNEITTGEPADMVTTIHCRRWCTVLQSGQDEFAFPAELYAEGAQNYRDATPSGNIHSNLTSESSCGVLEFIQTEKRVRYLSPTPAVITAESIKLHDQLRAFNLI